MNPPLPTDDATPLELKVLGIAELDDLHDHGDMPPDQYHILVKVIERLYSHVQHPPH
jgi:hypothetical protein